MREDRTINRKNGEKCAGRDKPPSNGKDRNRNRKNEEKATRRDRPPGEGEERIMNRKRSNKPPGEVENRTEESKDPSLCSIYNMEEDLK